MFEDINVCLSNLTADGERLKQQLGNYCQALNQIAVTIAFQATCDIQIRHRSDIIKASFTVSVQHLMNPHHTSLPQMSSSHLCTRHQLGGGQGALSGGGDDPVLKHRVLRNLSHVLCLQNQHGCSVGHRFGQIHQDVLHNEEEGNMINRRRPSVPRH